MSAATEPTKRAAGPRLQHVVAHVDSIENGAPSAFDEVLVFGQELDALRHLLGKTGWVYAAVPHGQSFAEALKVAKS